MKYWTEILGTGRAWLGPRDHALLLLAVQTGLRVSELTGLTTGDAHLGAGPHARCHGKGRKDRATPLTRQTVQVLRTWLAERGGEPGQPLFAPRAGRPSPATQSNACPAIAGMNVTPHTLRHSAMALLHAGMDTSVIALWMGHEDPPPPEHADMRIKEQVPPRPRG